MRIPDCATFMFHWRQKRATCCRTSELHTSCKQRSCEHLQLCDPSESDVSVCRGPSHETFLGQNYRLCRLVHISVVPFSWVIIHCPTFSWSLPRLWSLASYLLYLCIPKLRQSDFFKPKTQQNSENLCYVHVLQLVIFHLVVIYPLPEPRQCFVFSRHVRHP